jgi:hypothetical protein
MRYIREGKINYCPIFMLMRSINAVLKDHKGRRLFVETKVKSLNQSLGLFLLFRLNVLAHPTALLIKQLNRQMRIFANILQKRGMRNEE